MALKNQRVSLNDTTNNEHDAPAIPGRSSQAGRDEGVDRPSREQESRMSEELHDEWDADWNPSLGMLDSTSYPALPGMTQRWVRTMLNGREDATNIMRQMNKGWRPRKADTIPKGVFAPTFDMRGESVIGMEGMVLMHRPLRIHEKHAAHNREMSRLQERAVEETLMQSHEPGNRGFGAPRITAESEVSTGSRRAPVADD